MAGAAAVPVAARSLSLPAKRLHGVDALKGLACLMIVWHHLVFYGPMWDVVQPLVPGLTSWLFDYGRMAVQVFLVAGGFLAASSLAPQGRAIFSRPGRLIFRRYLRLARPYLVALAVTVLVAALVRPWFHHPSVPAAPTLWQLLTHVFMLHDVLGQEALSAGIWYVAIDLQLFALTVLLFSAARQVQQRWQGAPAWLAFLGFGLVAVLALSSLFVFNRLEGLDATWLYFFGYYALGMLAFWASTASTAASGAARANTGSGRRWLLAIAVLGGAALALDFRGRLVVALVTAFVLLALQQRVWSSWQMTWLPRRQLAQLGKMSYSIFLIHFSMALLVNALVSHFWPTQLLPNALGLLAAFALSLLAGAVLYWGVESRRALSPGRLKRSDLVYR
jgi:peptidoglycan/LPS O-acetylase OafA/YrhL